MLIVITIYIIWFILLYWGYFGYHIFLFFLSFNRSKKKVENSEITDLPTISILVPCCNEEKIIDKKIENLSNLEYPKHKVEIIFIDGSSSDNTIKIIQSMIKDKNYMKLVVSDRPGKIFQLNRVLIDIKSDIIVNTDVDGLMKPDSLKKIVKEFMLDENVGVVGAMVVPMGSIPEEVQYWKTLNQMRVLESRAYSSSIVIAVCYAFRNGLIEKFPEDVVADDIYVPFMANLKGYRAVYSKEIVVYETRTPRSLKELIQHKFRKTNAYMMEVLRFCYTLPYLNLFWRIIFLTRFLQIIALPWVLIIFLLFTILMMQFRQYEIILYSSAISFISLFIAHKIISAVKLPETPPKDNFFLALKVFIITTVLLISGSLSYPFYRQTSSYKKITKT